MMAVHPKLQVALDVLTISDALRIGREAMDAGADWLEAGTPLIKKEGIAVVRALKDFKGTVVADMKIMDAGQLEAQIAFDAGADIVTVLAGATDKTIRDAGMEARRRGKEIAVDMIGTPDVVHQYERMKKLPVDLLYVHSGLDQQFEGKSPLDDLRRLRDSTIPLGVAGGINRSNVKEAKLAGVHVIVVGGAITRSPSPSRATREIVEVLRT